MISLHQQPQWPTARRSGFDRRSLLVLTLVLISMSGLFTGLALRPLTYPKLFGSKSSPSVSISSSTNTIHTTAVASAVSIASAPERFYVSLLTSPTVIKPGDTLSVQTPALLNASNHPAIGVTCTLTVASPLSLPTPMQVTNAAGLAQWSIHIPFNAPAGQYQIQLNAKWGSYGANYINYVTVVAP